jgi:hypothetical protein
MFNCKIGNIHNDQRIRKRDPNYWRIYLSLGKSKENDWKFVQCMCKVIFYLLGLKSNSGNSLNARQ